MEDIHEKDEHMIRTIRTFIASVFYCLKLSWESSRWYTVLRIAGKIIVPLMRIAATYLAARLTNLLAGQGDAGGGATMLFTLLGASLALTAASVLINKAVDYATSMHDDILQQTMTLHLMDRALYADMSFFDNPAFYDSYSAVQRDSYAFSSILWSTIDSISSLITAIGAFAILSRANIVYGLIMLVVSIPSALSSKRYTKALYELSLSQMEGERKKGYLCYIAGDKRFAQDVRFFGMETMLVQKYKTLWQELFQPKKTMVRKRALASSLWELLPEAVTLGITVDISLKVLAGASIIGDYVFFTGMLGQLSSAMLMLFHSIISVYDNRLKIENMRKFEKTSVPLIQGGRLALERVERIEFSHVSFTYPNTAHRVLENISFSLDAGERLALVGVNGSGKTTLIKLMLRFYDPDSGSILINGHKLADYDIKSLRSCFSCYFQESPNYGFTLRENVALADLDHPADEAAIRYAVRRSDGDSILERVDSGKGLDTYLSRIFVDEGLELSGGQNQKIALSRAFFRRCSAVILDEPSSALDPEAEHRIFRQIEDFCQNKTVLFTCHRLSTVYLATKIAVIENGRILEMGTHAKLIAQSQRYAQLYHYQADKYQTVAMEE